MADLQLKTVHYRGVLVVFQIPDHWVEEYEPAGGGTFYDPDDESITLRLNVLTFATPQPVGVQDSAKALTALREMVLGPVETLANGQSFADGEIIHNT